MMPFINYPEREIAFKIVYYGPGLSGKTTNLLNLYGRLAPELRGELLTLNTADERTLFFDFFPIELGSVEGYRVRFNMYTVPGQDYYRASRQLILDGADGVVFVADSQPHREGENIDSFILFQRTLADYGLDWHRFPLALQYNKRDCPNPLEVGTLERRLELPDIPVIEAVAIRGRGVMETVRAVSRSVIMSFQP